MIKKQSHTFHAFIFTLGCGHGQARALSLQFCPCTFLWPATARRTCQRARECAREAQHACISWTTQHLDAPLEATSLLIHSLPYTHRYLKNQISNFFLNFFLSKYLLQYYFSLFAKIINKFQAFILIRRELNKYHALFCFYACRLDELQST